MLEIRNLEVTYGKFLALAQVSLSADANSFVGIIGRNGVGKTTLLRAISGLAPVSRGELRLGGESINRLSPVQRARRGISIVLDRKGIFPSLSVLENLTIAGRAPRGARPAWNVERVFGLFPRLKERLRNRGDALSGGEQRMLSIGRALMTNPEVLLLDEPTEGLAPRLVEEIRNVILSLKGQGMVVLLVDQNLATVFGACERLVVMRRGGIAAEGATTQMRNDRELLERHLGV